ncbi:RNA-binding protein 4B-like isoform X2 [Rhinoraja longicauda]
MVKIFVGNLSRPTTVEEVRALFEKYGPVNECDLIKNYGFVHMKDREAAKEAIENLHHYKLHGACINVEISKGGSKSSTKLHVGNIANGCTGQELQAKFEEYGPVLECDIVKDYAFVHLERSEDAMEAIRGLNGTEFKGCILHILNRNFIENFWLHPLMDQIVSSPYPHIATHETEIVANISVDE